MTKTIYKIFAAGVLIFFLAGGFLSAGVMQNNQIKYILKVKVRMANIRSGPSLENTIVIQKPQGALLNAVEKQGEWYHIILPAESSRPEIEAYIHQSTVEVVEEIPEKIKSPVEKPKKAKESQAEKKPEVLSSRTEKHPERISADPAFKKIYITAGFNAGMQEDNPSLSWTNSIYYEDASASIDYQVQTATPVNAALGYRFSPSLGVEIGADISSRNMEEGYYASVPHPLYFSAPREGTGSTSASLSENTLFLNAVYSLRFGNFGLDLFGGPAYIMAKAEVISGINYTESYPYYSISLSAETEEISQNVFGFNGGAELVFYLGESIAVHAGARYISGKAAFEPESGIPGPEITLGGLRAGGGIKIFF